jgi:ankyrin repeat protein
MTRALAICISIFLVLTQEASGMVDPGKVFVDPRVVELARSVVKGDVAEVQHQIASGADVRAKGQQGFTVTHFALYAGKNGPEVLRLLLKAGADPISRLENGADVPHYAAERDDANPEFMAVLLDAGVSPNLVGGPQKNSLLDAAVSGRNQAVVNLLLARGANVNFNDPFTGTALHTAVIIPDYQMATLLLDHGANPQLKDRQDPAIAPNVPRMTPADVYCRHQSGKRPHPTAQQSADFEAMKAAFARRGVVLPCGL